MNKPECKICLCDVVEKEKMESRIRWYPKTFYHWPLWAFISKIKQWKYREFERVAADRSRIIDWLISLVYVQLKVLSGPLTAAMESNSFLVLTYSSSHAGSGKKKVEEKQLTRLLSVKLVQPEGQRHSNMVKNEHNRDVPAHFHSRLLVKMKTKTETDEFLLLILL